MSLCKAGRIFDEKHPVCRSCVRQGGGCPQSRSTEKVQVVQAQQKSAGTAGQPNKTEAEYGRLLALEFPRAQIVFEGLTLRMQNGHKYTPDWVVIQSGELPILVEVKARGKNGYRLPSYQRAKLAFDQAKTEWSCFRFRWAEKHCGAWDIREVKG